MTTSVLQAQITKYSKWRQSGKKHLLRASTRLSGSLGRLCLGRPKDLLGRLLGVVEEAPSTTLPATPFALGEGAPHQAVFQQGSAMCCLDLQAAWEGAPHWAVSS